MKVNSVGMEGNQSLESSAATPVALVIFLCQIQTPNKNMDALGISLLLSYVNASRLFSGGIDVIIRLGGKEEQTERNSCLQYERQAL